MTIEKFMKDYAALYVSNQHGDIIAEIAGSIMEKGIKENKRDDFNYTVWQREYFDKMSVGEFAAKASAYAESHPYTGKAQVL